MSRDSSPIATKIDLNELATVARSGFLGAFSLYNSSFGRHELHRKAVDDENLAVIQLMAGLRSSEHPCQQAGC